MLVIIPLSFDVIRVFLIIVVAQILQICLAKTFEGIQPLPRMTLIRTSFGGLIDVMAADTFFGSGFTPISVYCSYILSLFMVIYIFLQRFSNFLMLFSWSNRTSSI